jgi:hypothetical protein
MLEVVSRHKWEQRKGKIKIKKKNWSHSFILVFIM